MLTWYKETYAATAADEAASWITRIWTPDGLFHDPGSTGKLSRREDWRLHRLQVFVLATTTGYVKQGVLGNLIAPMDWPGSWSPISPLHGIHHGKYGLIYEGPPIIVTHGFGWAFYKGALVDTDKVYMRALYEPTRGGVA